MRRWIIGAFCAGLALAGGYAVAQIVPALPFQLQNNTVADATQVMANFNQILNNVNTNGAKNGANSDITSLLGLTTPLAPSVGGTSTWTGGTSTGAANAQVVTPVVPSTFSLATGSKIVFKAGFTNSAKVTLNVAASGVIDVYRTTSLGVIETAGGEIINGSMVEATYDGTRWQLSATPYILIGEIRDYAGSGTPGGFLAANGACVSQTTYAALFSLVGSTWGACGAGLFAVPDFRGRAAIAPDAGVGRVTLAGSSCSAVLAAGCGAENQSMAQANLPNVNFNLTINDTRTWATSNQIQSAGAATGFAAGANLSIVAAQAVVVTGGSIGGTAASGGTSAPLTTLQPSLVVTKIVRF